MSDQVRNPTDRFSHRHASYDSYDLGRIAQIRTNKEDFMVVNVSDFCTDFIY